MSAEMNAEAAGSGSELAPEQQQQLLQEQQQQQQQQRDQRQQHHQAQVQHLQQLQQEAAAIKLTRGTSCVLCQQRKVRCDKNKPCANCVKAKVECRVIPPQPPRRRKKRLQEKDLIERLRRYESLLAENGVKFDAIGHDLRTDGGNLDDVEELEDDFQSLKATPEADSSPSNVDAADKGPTGSWFSLPLHKEFRASEQLLQDSSEEEENFGSFIHRAFDKMFGNQDGFPFVIGGLPQVVTSAHPSTIHIFQLWQIYIDNINPLLKITHIPTVQAQILEATSDLKNAPKNIECLMFAVYLMAITTLEEPEVQRLMGEPKKTLITRFCAATQQALVNASFMRDSDSITLQAFLLYLFAVRFFTDPRQIFCLVGIAVRIAQRMGLHRDPGGYGLPPFEVELRRRLWWSIVGYDRRIGEITGSTVTALSSGGDCKIPLNVNDNELHIEGREMPTSHTGPTEMLFALTRIEISMAVSSDSNRDSLKIHPGQDKPTPPTNNSKPTGGPTIHLAGQDGPAYTLDGFCAHIEGTYLAHCDPKIPLHFFTLTMTRQALCKMRVIGFLMRMHSSEAMPLEEVERESLFLQATQMIEYDNVVQSSESLQPFKWYSMHHFPFPAYMFLIHELRNRISGPMVERAWDAITVNHDLRGLLNSLHSPMHQAFGNLFLKAWDAHEASQLAAGKQVTPPRFIGTMRERAEKRRRAREENREELSLTQAPIQFPSTATASARTPSGRGMSMMTPPSGDASAVGGAAGMGSAAGGDEHDMDWSYMYNGDPGNFQSASSFTPFAMPGANLGGIGGMGLGANMPGMGLMGGPGRNMFGG